MNRFFNPYVGSKYHKGINGKRILVIGASFYCDHNNDCEYFESCTDVIKKDSSVYNRICPHYSEQNFLLSDEPTHCVTDWNQTYQYFADYIGQLIGISDYIDIWNHLAFTNYVQFMLPANNDEYRETFLSDLSERDFDSFIETILELKPHIVVIWGCKINSRLKEQNEYLINREELNQTEYYLCHIRVPNIAHDIAIINPYHPSSSAWHTNIEKFDKYMQLVTNNK